MDGISTSSKIRPDDVLNAFDNEVTRLSNRFCFDGGGGGEALWFMQEALIVGGSTMIVNIERFWFDGGAVSGRFCGRTLSSYLCTSAQF